MASMLPRPLLGTAGDFCSFLKTHLLGDHRLTEHDLGRAATMFTHRRVKKGAGLLLPGQVCAFQGVVTCGCLRVYDSHPDGCEGVLYFAPEGWWISDLESLLTGKPSRLGIDAVETTDVFLVDRPGLMGAGGGDLADHLLRIVAENTLVRLQKRIAGRMRKTATQRYTEFRRMYPGLDLRIPQYQIAAYLGISAEFLSKLRRRFRSSRS